MLADMVFIVSSMTGLVKVLDPIGGRLERYVGSKIFAIVAEADVVIQVAPANKALSLINFLRFISVC